MADLQRYYPTVSPLFIGGGSAQSAETLQATQAGNFNAVGNAFYPVDPGAGNVNATMPAAAASGAVGQGIVTVEIKNITANVGTVTILPTGADTIDGQPNLVVPAGGSVRLVSDGVSNWMAAP